METEKVIQRVLKETGIRMANLYKAERAVYGTVVAKGKFGGVGEESNAKTILAEYDKLGGYMVKDGMKVKNGVFFNSKTGKAQEDVVIVLLITVNGKVVEHVEGEKESLELKIAKGQLLGKVDEEEQ